MTRIKRISTDLNTFFSIFILSYLQKKNRQKGIPKLIEIVFDLIHLFLMIFLVYNKKSVLICQIRLIRVLFLLYANYLTVKKI